MLIPKVNSIVDGAVEFSMKEVFGWNFVWEIFSHMDSCNTAYVIADGLALSASTRCVPAKQFKYLRKTDVRGFRRRKPLPARQWANDGFAFVERIPVRLVRRSAMVGTFGSILSRGRSGQLPKVLCFE